jgi:hypothetical protein
MAVPPVVKAIADTGMRYADFKELIETGLSPV